MQCCNEVHERLHSILRSVCGGDAPISSEQALVDQLTSLELTLFISKINEAFAVRFGRSSEDIYAIGSLASLVDWIARHRNV